MDVQHELVKAIRTGKLATVKALLDAGLAASLDESPDEPSFELGLACFLGHEEIIRELVARGVKVNCRDNRLPTSALSMAIRGGKAEAIRTLIELGVGLPDGLDLGLSEHQITLAHLKAVRDGYCQPRDTVDQEMAMEFEEIEVMRVPGTDTVVLESEALRNIVKGMG